MIGTFNADVLAAFDRVTAAATAAGVTEARRTPRIRHAEERLDALVRAYELGSPPVLRDDVEAALAVLEREMMAEVQRIAAQPAPDAFDALFEGV